MKTVKFMDFKNEINAVNAEVLRISERGSKCWSTLGTIVNMSFGDDKPIEIGINWCACGTVSIECAELFAKEMQQVLQLAKNFKYNGYTIEY